MVITPTTIRWNLMLAVTVGVGVTVTVRDIEYTSLVFHRLDREKNILYLPCSHSDFDNDH